MKQTKYFLLLLTFLISVGSLWAQDKEIEEKIQLDVYKMEKLTNDVEQLLQYAVANLETNPTINHLINKFDTELNTVASCVLLYSYAEILELNTAEQTELEKRIKAIANAFVANQMYVLFETSTNSSPVFGIKEERIANKKVLRVLLNNDCVSTSSDLKTEKMYQLFNSQITKALRQ